MDKVKFGVIGIGNMGSSHTKFISELQNCVLTAVCDENPEAFKRMTAPDPDKVAKFTDAETFFKEADVDAVIIAVPHYAHPDLAIMAMQHGKHVIVEKPIAVHKKEAFRLLAEVEKHPELKCAAMFNQRTIPAHRKIKQLIDSGELGKITRINWIITDWFRSQYYYDSGDWRASWRGEGGGVLLNQCPHQLDLMQWFFGLPSSVRAITHFGKYHDIEVEDEVTAYLEYPNGATGVFISTTGEAPGTNRLEIAGDRGKLVYEGGKLEFIRNEELTSEFRANSKTAFGTPAIWNVSIPCEAGNPHMHRDIISNMADAIQKDVPLTAALPEGIRALELGNAILLSGWQNGAEVTLPIDHEDYAARLEKLAANSRYVKKTITGEIATGNFGNSF
ncbi:MAG: Gfo/Idh/MocA family oxidoreductase [Lentisphaeria bacterium]|nr:Gfo/Idh/MocA family oxidoreductase [Lentisphaeria bacterium]